VNKFKNKINSNKDKISIEYLSYEKLKELTDSKNSILDLNNAKYKSIERAKQIFNDENYFNSIKKLIRKDSNNIVKIDLSVIPNLKSVEINLESESNSFFNCKTEKKFRKITMIKFV
jgi:hypothetical protein